MCGLAESAVGTSAVSAFAPAESAIFFPFFVQIEGLKVQLSEQEMSNKTQAEELSKLHEQLEQLRKEEHEYKQKVQTRPHKGEGQF